MTWQSRDKAAKDTIDWIASLITHANYICAGPDYARNDDGDEAHNDSGV